MVKNMQSPMERSPYVVPVPSPSPQLSHASSEPFSPSSFQASPSQDSDILYQALQGTYSNQDI
ncbi:hypothetical protein ABEB36_014618 [Hypothenemus hampei]|uniref:Uncharacterized protein n=1 Tax=Hypothenemus hampei TaxID=57062 RepID=A0ABD1E4E7_HYPHA